MSLNTKTKESTTVDGSVKYQAVECHRCGYDTPTEKAVIAYLPSDANKKPRTYSNTYFKVEYASDGRQIPYCTECAESIFGPTPTSNYQRELDEFIRERERHFLLVAIVHIILVSLSLAALMFIIFGAPPA